MSVHSLSYCGGMEPTSATREKILDATMACMRDNGVRGATTKMIASRAGVSEGSIYNHFTNRSELVVAAFRQATSGVRRRAFGLRGRVGASTVEDNLVELMAEAIGFLRGILPVAGSVMGDPDLREWFVRGQEPGADREPDTPLLGVVEIARYLEGETRQGRLAQRDSWIPAASMLSGACLQYAYAELLSLDGVAGLMPDGARSEREYARRVVRTLFEPSGGDPVMP